MICSWIWITIFLLLVSLNNVNARFVMRRASIRTRRYRDIQKDIQKEREEKERKKQDIIDIENKKKYVMYLFDRDNTCLVPNNSYLNQKLDKFTSFDELHKDYIWITKEPGILYYLLCFGLIIFFSFMYYSMFMAYYHFFKGFSYS